jgi:urea transporter
LALNDQSIALTIFALVGSAISIILLARITEHQKSTLHGMFAAGLLNMKALIAR